MKVRFDYVFDAYGDVVRFDVFALVDSDDEVVASGSSEEIPDAISSAIADAISHDRMDVVPALTALLTASRVDTPLRRVATA